MLMRESDRATAEHLHNVLDEYGAEMTDDWEERERDEKEAKGAEEEEQDAATDTSSPEDDMSLGGDREDGEEWRSLSRSSSESLIYLPDDYPVPW